MIGRPNRIEFYQEEIENAILQLSQAVDEKTRQNLETRLRVAKQYLALLRGEAIPCVAGEPITLLTVEQGGHISSLAVNQ